MGELINTNAQLGELIKLQKQMLTALQGNNKALKDQVEQTKKASEVMFSLASASEATKNANEGLLITFGKMANSTDGMGKAWTMFSRILSGSPLWRLQNYVRSVGQALDLFRTRTENNVKATNESAKAISELNDQYNLVQEQINKMDMANFDNLLETNQEVKMQYEMLTLVFGEGEETKQKALERTTKMYMNEQLKMQKVRDKIESKMKKQLAAEERLHTKLNKKKLKEELKLQRNLVSQLGLEGKEEILKDDLEKVRLRQQELRDAGGLGRTAAGAEFARLGKVSKKLEEQIAITKERDDLQRRLKDIGIMGWFRRTAKFVTSINYLGKMKSGFMTLFSISKMAVSYFMYFMLAILLLFPIFEVIKQVFGAADVLGTVVTAVKEILGGVFLVVEGIVMVFKAFFGSGTFGERLTILLQGFGKIFGGLGVIIFSVMKGVLKLGVGLLIASLTLLIALTIKPIVAFVNFFRQEGALRKLGEAIKEKLWTNGIKKWFDQAGGWGGIATTIWEGFIGILDKIGRWTVGIIENVIDSIKPFALGGTVMGGLSLVGERGPELVKMPRGARVFSNMASRAMLANSGNTTINVSVNGRMGATDTELRDMAKKIGRMINVEINRTTSSSTNVRY